MKRQAAAAAEGRDEDRYDSKRRSTDALSKLPEQVLNRVLCFLPQKEALRTCVLSKSWRRLGSTRSKLELSQIDDFDGDRKKFRSVLYGTLRRYNHRNLPIYQLRLKMKFDLPPVAFRLEFLRELYLEDCDLTNIYSTDHHARGLLLLKHLRKLSLDRVCVSNATLETLLSRCPLIQYLGISNDCAGLTKVNAGKARNLKHFVCWQGQDEGRSIEIDVPTLETIRVVKCLVRYFHDQCFPHLKSICMINLNLSSESFGFFRTNYMPSLEVLELNCCYGFQEFSLSSTSIKHLDISRVSMPIKATMDAPNMVYFKLKSRDLPSVSFKPISSEWKSHLDLPITVYKHHTVELGKVLKALSPSQITLQLNLPLWNEPRNTKDNASGGFYDYKPLVLEHLSLGVYNYSHSTVPLMFNYLFRACRPRYIYDAHSLAHSSYLTREVVWEVLLNDRERSDYFWNQDLVEVGIETSCYNANEWRPVHGNSLSEIVLPNNQKVRIELKWRQ